MTREAEPGAAIRLVMVNCATKDEAEAIGRGLVEHRLAAAVNIVPGLVSFYRWEGEPREAAELQLVAKTSLAKVEAAIAFIRKHHSYDQPGILSLAVDGGDAGYLAWIAEATEEEGAGPLSL